MILFCFVLFFYLATEFFLSFDFCPLSMYPNTFISEHPPSPTPQTHHNLYLCSQLVRREATKIQLLLWALKEKGSTMIDHSKLRMLRYAITWNCPWSLSDNPAQSLGCDCWLASLSPGSELENIMEENWGEEGLSPFLRSCAHIFICLSLTHHPYYLRTWNRLPFVKVELP